MKREIVKEVRYSTEEWERLKSLAAKNRKPPAVYIREKALKNKILDCIFTESMETLFDYITETGKQINAIAEAVNRNKDVFDLDYLDVKEYSEKISAMLHDGIPKILFKEHDFHGSDNSHFN